MYIHSYSIPIPGVKKKTIFHFSDSHLTAFDALSNEDEVAYAQKQIMGWKLTRRYFGTTYNEPYSELEYDAQFMELINEANRHDAVVLTGDTMDFVSGANLRLMEKGIASLTVPYAIVCGNHEPPQEIPDDMALSVMKQPFSLLDLGDLLIASFNNNERAVSTEQLAALRALKKQEKPVLVIFHIPVMTEENRDALLEAGVYFQFNYDGCPQENLDFIAELTAEDSPVAAVFTGHLHFSSVTEIANGVMQYGASQAVGGHCHVYTVGE